MKKICNFGKIMGFSIHDVHNDVGATCQVTWPSTLVGQWNGGRPQCKGRGSVVRGGRPDN